MSQLVAACNSKTRFYATQCNTFGLTPIATCPGATCGLGGCAYIKPGGKKPTCYAKNIANIYKGAAARLNNNTALLRSADKDKKIDLLCAEFTRFREHERARTTQALYYRLHWAGDIFDQMYAEALQTALSRFPDVTFWGTTRSFFAVPLLAGLQNIRLFLSLDPVNLVDGLAVYFQNTTPWLRICYLAPTDDFVARYQAIRQPGWPLQAPQLKACPSDLGLVATEEACKTCGNCWGRCPTLEHVWFKTY